MTAPKGARRPDKPMTQYCETCKTRKPLVGFSRDLKHCAECRASGRVQAAKEERERALAAAKEQRKEARRERRQAAANETNGNAKKQPKSTKKQNRPRMCPVCLRAVQVAGTTLVAHKNGKGEPCRASGRTVVRPVSPDALDHRVRGSFEGGRR